jgi:hypothetical protein
MERRLGYDHAMIDNSLVHRVPKVRLLLAALALALTSPVSAQTFGEHPVRYGVTSSFYYDGRGDNRDFPTNGVFPGNFAANPLEAAIGGAAGFLEINPRRSAQPYPSRTYVGPMRDWTYCQGYLYDPTSRLRVRC